MREKGGAGGCWGLVWKISTSYKSAVVGMKLEGKVATRWGSEVGGDAVWGRGRAVAVESARLEVPRKGERRSERRKGTIDKEVSVWWE